MFLRPKKLHRLTSELVCVHGEKRVTELRKPQMKLELHGGRFLKKFEKAI
jgi:hypothetical protein